MHRIDKNGAARRSTGFESVIAAVCGVVVAFGFVAALVYAVSR
jgi:hypothetical protein